MATLEKAIEISAQAHAGVRDKQGEPYVLHPLRVMQGLNSGAEHVPAESKPEARIVAVLHDVVEDTSVTLADIRAAGFSADVLAALNLVTHKRGVSYADYVIACKPNAIARAVKLADLRDNSHPSRLLLRPERFQADAARMQRYVLSIRFLTDEISEEDYRGLMAKLA